MGRTFKCMFFIPNDLLFLLQEKKRECKDQSPTLLFRQNLAFRRFFTVIHNLHWLIDFKCCQLCCSFRFVASFKFSRAHSKFSPHYLK